MSLNTGQDNPSNPSEQIGSLVEFDMEYFRKIDGENGWIAFGKENLINPKYFTVINEAGDQIGIVGIFDTREKENYVHYVVDPAFRGHNLAAKFIHAIMDKLGLDYVYISIDPKNIASIKTAESLPGVRKVSDKDFEEKYEEVLYIYVNQHLKN